MSGVRVVVVSNLNYFAHVLLAPTVADPGIDVVGLVEVQGDYKGQRGFGVVQAHYRRTGLVYTATKAGWALAGSAALRRRTHRRTVQGLRHGGHPRLAVASVADPATATLLRTTRPDVLLSVNCPQRIDTALLAHARVGGINVHGSLLPSLAGLAPYVWALAEGLEETGITVHEMREEFDSGRILWQHRQTVAPRVSAFELYRQLAVSAGEAIPAVVKRVAEEGFGWGREQERASRSYRSLPTAADVRAVRRNGHRLTRLSDLTGLLRGADAG